MIIGWGCLEMIKILHYGLSSNWGGIESSLFKVFTNIDRGKVQFDFIDENTTEPKYFSKFKELGAEIHKVTPRKQSIYRNKKDLIKLFANQKYDILHFHANTLSYITPINVALKHNCKVIIHSRSTGAPSSKLTKALHTLNFHFLKNKKVTRVAVSSDSGKWLFGNKEYRVINNSVDIERFKFKEDVRGSLRNQMDIDSDLVIGHVGTFLNVKNHDFIVEVFNKYHSKNKNSTLILAGDGLLLDNIKQKVKNLNLQDRVKFLGSRNDIPDLMCAMDCFLFPSYYEGYPNVILEAQTSGLPILMSDHITDEVIIRENCIKLSISNNLDNWVMNIGKSRIDLLQRKKAFVEVYNANLNIEHEISSIMSIYFKLIND